MEWLSYRVDHIMRKSRRERIGLFLKDGAVSRGADPRSFPGGSDEVEYSVAPDRSSMGDDWVGGSRLRTALSLETRQAHRALLRRRRAGDVHARDGRQALEGVVAAGDRRPASGRKRLHRH